MKKILIFSILAVLIFAVSCEKDPDLRMPECVPAVTPLITFTANSDAYINSKDVANYKTEIKVDVYFKSDKPKSMSLYVKYVHDTVSSTGLLKDNITSFPTVVSYTMNDLIKVLPSIISIDSIKPGDTFTYGVDVTNEDGSVTRWDDSLYISSSPDVNNYPGSSIVASVDVLCPFNINDFVGQYDLSDGYPEDACVVTVSVDPEVANGLIISDVYTGTGTSDDGVIKIVINPQTYKVSVPAQAAFISDLWGYGPGSIGEGTGKINTCDYGIKFDVPMDVSSGSFGVINFVLTKK